MEVAMASEGYKSEDAVNRNEHGHLKCIGVKHMRKNLPMSLT